MPGALEGIKVLDLSRVVAGPMCAMILGDLGADVVKIERPGTGDDLRTWGPPYAQTESAYYLCLNRNKRSLTLDLKSPQGRSILMQMAQEADVLIENFKTDDLEAKDIGYEALRECNPALIFCSISGYGRTGPDRQKPGYDFAIQGRGGYMSITGQPDGPPTKVGLPIIDVLAALNAAIAILAAVHTRSVTGKGQLIDIALLDAEVACLVNQASNYLIGGEKPTRWGNANPNVVPYESFKAKDGWFNIAVGNNVQFERLCRALGLSELADDAQYTSNALRVKNRGSLIPALAEKVEERTVDEWLEILDREKVPADPILDVDEVFSDPQVLARDMLVTMPHPTIGSVRLAGNAIKMSDYPVSYRRHPPLLGEQTDEILTELGFRPDAIDVLRSEGVI